MILSTGFIKRQIKAFLGIIIATITTYLFQQRKEATAENNKESAATNHFITRTRDAKEEKVQDNNVDSKFRANRHLDLDCFIDPIHSTIQTCPSPTKSKLPISKSSLRLSKKSKVTAKTLGKPSDVAKDIERPRLDKECLTGTQKVVPKLSLEAEKEIFIEHEIPPPGFFSLTEDPLNLHFDPLASSFPAKDSGKGNPEEWLMASLWAKEADPSGFLSYANGYRGSSDSIHELFGHQ